MIGQPSLALAILGLGAVHGLPTQSQPVEERAPQIFGPPSSSFGPGDLPRVGGDIACNPLTEKSCSWWPEITSPPADNGDSFSFGPIHPRDLDAIEKIKRSSVDDRKNEIKEIENRITDLQNLEYKSHDDREELRRLLRELKRLTGIDKIIAPPGTETTFTPGKRDTADAPQLKKRQGLIYPGPGAEGSYASRDGCPASLNEADRILGRILDAIDHDRRLRWHEDLVMKAFEGALAGCGMALEEDEDDQGFVTLKVYRTGDHSHSGGRRLWPKRSAAEEAKFDTTGLREAHDVLLETLGGAEPTVATWMVLKMMEAELAAQGVVVKRQSGGSGDTFKLGEDACQPLKAALAALGLRSGSDQSRIPPNILVIEQLIVLALQICNLDAAGWTHFTPGKPIPGGPIVPGQPIGGGAIVPGQPIGGGSIVPGQPISGGTIVPGQPIGGGTIVPGQPGGGGSIVPGQPIDGGRIDPQRPGDGGRLNPERPEGGRIIPERPVGGGEAKPGCRLEECWE